MKILSRVIKKKKTVLFWMTVNTNPVYLTCFSQIQYNIKIKNELIFS